MIYERNNTRQTKRPPPNNGVGNLVVIIRQVPRVRCNSQRGKKRFLNYFESSQLRALVSDHTSAAVWWKSVEQWRCKNAHSLAESRRMLIPHHRDTIRQQYGRWNFFPRSICNRRENRTPYPVSFNDEPFWESLVQKPKVSNGRRMHRTHLQRIAIKSVCASHGAVRYRAVVKCWPHACCAYAHATTSNLGHTPVCTVQ